MIATPHKLQQIEWLSMRLPVPGDWEIVRHSARLEKGRLVFVDRHQQRLLLGWAACSHAPDVKQLFSDYRARAEEENPGCAFTDLPRKTGWSGFRRTAGGEVLTHAGRYDAELKRWIELTLSWGHGFDATLEGVLLREFSTVHGTGGGSRWRAFGIDVRAPEGWGLQGAVVKPGEVSFTFRRDRSETVVRRTGLSKQWFDGDIKNFLRRQLDAGSPVFALIDYGGHPAVACSKRESGRRFDLLMGRLRDRRDIAWHCAEADAVLQITTLSPLKAPALPEKWIVQASGVLPACLETCAPSRSGATPDMLDAVPVRNASVRVDREPSGGLVLRVALERRWYMRPPFSWVLPFSRDRAAALDKVGESVWRSCDGRHTIGQIVEAFAGENLVSFQEARLGVMQFLRDLTRRGFIAVAIPAAEEET